MAYKIIVADASPSVQKTAQMAFPEPEFELYPFEDGLALLEAAPEIRPAAVLLAPSLVGRDGYEAGRLLRARQDFARVVFVFMKGTFEPFDGERLSAADYDEIVQKPFDSEALAASVRGLIEKRLCPSTLPEDPAPRQAASRAAAEPAACVAGPEAVKVP
jgi:DNA-binding response OmpR family regulator